MSFWREDPDGMDERIVEAMKEMGHSKHYHDDQKVLEKFHNDKAFGRTNGWMAVAQQAEHDYTQNLVGAAESRMEMQTDG